MKRGNYASFLFSQEFVYNVSDKSWFSTNSLSPLGERGGDWGIVLEKTI